LKAEFSTSLLLLITHQFSVSHGPSEIILICWFYAQKHKLLFSMLKTVVYHFLPKILWWIKFKRTAF